MGAHTSGKWRVLTTKAGKCWSSASSLFPRLHLYPLPKRTARCRPSSFLERPPNWPSLCWPLIFSFCRQFLVALSPASLSTFTSLGSALPDPLGLAAVGHRLPAAGTEGCLGAGMACRQLPAPFGNSLQPDRSADGSHSLDNSCSRSHHLHTCTLPLVAL